MVLMTKKRYKCSSSFTIRS